MNLSSVPGFSGVRVTQSVVSVLPVIFMFSHLCLSIVGLFFFDLRIHSHSFLAYDPDNHIGLLRRRHDHKLVLAMILLINGSLGIITNRRFNL